MKISMKEHKSALEYMTKKRCPDKYLLPFRNLVLGGLELSQLDDATLRQLIGYLPTNSFLTKSSYAVRGKIKDTLLYRARPHMDPDVWPKVFRKINNNSRSGLRDFGGGQLGVLNDKAMSMPLRGTFAWNEREFGELIIMGTWKDIAGAIGKAKDLSFVVNFDDIYKGDVNVEFDRMYTDRKIPLDDLAIVVTYIPSLGFEPTTEEGRVVLDPRGELVQAAGGAVSGFAGAGTSFSGVIEIASASLDTIGLVSDMADKFGVKLKTDHSQKGKCTFVVSYYQVGRDYKCRKTEKKNVSGEEFMTICRDLANIS